jgi:hypothetical protein
MKVLHEYKWYDPSNTLAIHRRFESCARLYHRSTALSVQTGMYAPLTVYKRGLPFSEPSLMINHGHAVSVRIAIHYKWLALVEPR